MVTLLNLINLLIFYLLAVSVSYLFIYAIASKFYRRHKYPHTEKYNRFAVLFPAYKEDKVIEQSVISFLQQNYPSDKYEIIVISDQMEDATNELLSQFPIRLLKANYQNSSKAKAMAMAMDATKDEKYDMVIIMDADNTTTPYFLEEINCACNAGLQAIQAHRLAKNTNTDIAILDAVSEEINNSIFRKGHVAMGFSSALIGSGMAFETNWFRRNVKNIHTAGEDKELEALLLKQNIYVDYLDHLYVYDEKTQKKDSMAHQRRRWFAAQLGSLKASLPYFPKAFILGNFDYCDKVLQWMMLPRIILIFLTAIFTLLTSIIHPEMSIKWWSLSFLLLFTLCIVIPTHLYNRQLLRALFQIPALAWIMFINLFKLKGVNKEFIHTEHDHN
ncbi:glycosyltransferase family 2 protein [uncultured Bacteroides sp.]|uniref:glycosyltransferase n=1 Tax=uncultured Bacteroides sp. TaxID=162156 RepID=UPI002AA8310D|nr:glycosyltransferase [uncultured Bacteroides sp.]